MVKPVISAVIPAAGPSTRMGRFKPLLPIGSKSMIGRVIAGLQKTGIENIIIVTGHKKEVLKKELAGVNVRIVENESFMKGIASSITSAIAHLGRPCSGFFLWPADIPLVRPHTLHQLAQAHTTSPSAIIRPSFQGCYGYPLLLPFQWADDSQCCIEGDDFQQCLNKSLAPIHDVPVADGNVILDVNTPEDYRKALDQWRRHDVPTAAECEEILTVVHPIEERVLRHSRKVAGVAGRIGEALMGKGMAMDLEAIRAGGLLHDIAKGCKDHAFVGQQMIIEMGYPRIAIIVGGHTDLQVDKASGIAEVEVVHLADKLVANEKIIGIEKRFQPPLHRWAHDPVAIGHTKRRLAAAIQLQQKIEASLKHPLEDLFHF